MHISHKMHKFYSSHTTEHQQGLHRNGQTNKLNLREKDGNINSIKLQLHSQQAPTVMCPAISTTSQQTNGDKCMTKNTAHTCIFQWKQQQLWI